MARTLNLEAREKILKAAAGLIHERGFRDVSMEDVSEEAGIKKANLFHYYPTKEALGLAVLDFVSQPMKDKVAERFSRGTGDPIKMVEGMFAEVADGMRRGGCHKGCFFGNLAQELSDLDERMRGKIAEHFRFWSDQIADALERSRRAGYFKSALKSRGAAQAILSLFEGAMTLCKAEKDAGPLDDARKAASDYLHAYKV